MKKCGFLFLAAWLSLASGSAAEVSDLLGPDPAVRKLAGGFGFGEGPAWHAGEQALYFSDLKNKSMHRWSERDGVTKVRQGEETFTNGIVIDPDGLLVYCETGAFQVIDDFPV